VKKIEGAQFAGMINISKEVSGASFAGIYNRTGTLRGLQFSGIVNVIDTIESGISIALVNIVKKGFYKEWALTFADYLNIELSYKMGLQKFYTIFNVGGNFTDDHLWAHGIGFGNRTALGKRFDFQPEIVLYHYFPDNFKYIDAWSTRIKFGFVYNLNQKFGIAVAPSIYHFHCKTNQQGQPYKISPISEIFSNNSKRNIFGMGISVGLILR
jgi:hypothetical protein